MALAQSISADMLPRLVEGARLSLYGTRDETIIRLLADTGARPAELAAMSLSAVTDADGATLTGRCRWQTMKRGKARDCALSAGTVEALRRLLAEVPPERRSDPLFRSQRGRFHPVAMRQLVIRIAERAGLDCSAYSIRHLAIDAAAARAQGAGATVRDLADWTGHRDITTPASYMNARSTARKAIDRPAGIE